MVFKKKYKLEEKRPNKLLHIKLIKEDKIANFLNKEIIL